MTCQLCKPIVAYLLEKYPTLRTKLDECFCAGEE